MHRLRKPQVPAAWSAKIRGPEKPLTTQGQYGDRVTVHISTWRCPGDLLKRAIESILKQTYENFRLVITPDGDLPALADLVDYQEDERVLIHPFETNRGQFFAHDVVARATGDHFLALQDADDVSAPNRLEAQVRLVVDKQADVALSAMQNIRAGRRLSTVRPQAGSVHLGTYRTKSLLEVGGYYSDVRLGYDTFVVLAMNRYARVAYSNEVHYYRHHRLDSMTNNAATGHGSPARRRCLGELRGLRKQLAICKTPAQLREHLEARFDATQRDAEVERLKERLWA